MLSLNLKKRTLIGENKPCSIEQFKKTLEQKFYIQIEPKQLEQLFVFMNQLDESQITGLVNWTDMFKKFSEIE